MQEQAQRDPLLVEREKTHGSFAYNSDVWRKFVLASPFPPEMNNSQILAMQMIYLKIARVLSKPMTKDSWDDIAGYAKLGSEACE